MNEQWNEEAIIRERKRQRIAAMQKSKQRQLMFRKYFRILAPLAAAAVVLVLLITAGTKAFHKDSGGNGKETGKKETETEAELKAEPETEAALAGQAANSLKTIESEGISAVSLGISQLQEEGRQKLYSAAESEETVQLGSLLESGKELFSEYAVLVDVSSGSIAAEKNAFDRMNPASMTKVLTALVAAEHVENLDDTFTMTLEITDYGYVNDCSSAGFEKDETVTVRDLFYGTILPSGADAAVGLATYVAGSQEAFVELMN